ncbi:MAG: hypothetical protein GY696_40290 [Gammaproteobacteria bacterium]|nr:hypothetical protein [Gammaproteobacteria bacterium]
MRESIGFCTTEKRGAEAKKTARSKDWLAIQPAGVKDWQKMAENLRGNNKTKKFNYRPIESQG